MRTDQITRVTDPIGVATAYQVDGLGNLNSESSPDSGATASTYDGPKRGRIYFPC